MSNNNKIRKPGIVIKNNYPGFLFEQDEDVKDFSSTLDDSVENTKDDISKNKIKSDELTKVLSVTKDNTKRNYISTQLKDEKNDLLKKNKLLKNQEASLKKAEEDKNKPDKDKKEIAPILSKAHQSSQVALNISEIKNLRKKINEVIQNNMENMQPKKQIIKQKSNFNSPSQIQEPVKKKSFKVVFDKSSEKPWQVLFTERGFLVDGTTRLSFENIHSAINKNYNIVLNAGQGLVLDPIKMNKILKYESRF